MKGAHYVFVSVWMGIWMVTRGLLIPRALHAPTISLEEYGVVLKPGCIMSTADITHVQQGFRVPIPVLDGSVVSEVPVMTLCEKYLKYGDSFKKVCKSVGKVRDWLQATVKSLMKIQKRIVFQAIESLPLDDRQWIVGVRRYTEWDVRRDNPTQDFEGSSPMRNKCSKPELCDVHYHILGLAGGGMLTIIDNSSRCCRNQWEKRTRICWSWLIVLSKLWA